MAIVVVPSSIVFEVLEKHNYEDWSEAIEAYLKARDLWDVVESNEQPPKTDEEFKAWEKKNAAALHAIMISCGTCYISKIRGIREANTTWGTLRAYFYPPLAKRMACTINPQQGDEENVDEEYKKAYKSLADALSRRDISDAIKLCKKNPAPLTERLPNSTPVLHELIRLCPYSHLDELVEILKGEHFPKDALEMRDSSGRTPLAMAIDTPGYSRLINELYSIKPSSVWTLEDRKYGATVITECFQSLRFRFASKVLKEHPGLIFAKDVNGLSPLYVAARAPHLFHSHELDSHRFALSPSPYKFSKFAYYSRSIIVHREWRLSKVLQDLRERQLSTVIDRLIPIRNAIRDSKMTSDLLRDAFFEAIKCGNFNFIVMLINYDKNFLEEVNDMSKNIYMCAIEYRQAKVFSLIFWDKKQWRDREKYAKACEDKWKNNLLHMTATWTPPKALDRIPKPAVLMITEAMWFEEVLKLSRDLGRKVNMDGKIPYELFKENHRNLMTGAERGMKESAASWAIVGPLVITIMFAAAFQIPGGYNQETGFPIFLNKTWFQFYMVLVSISLFSATISVLKFLEILSSDYQEKDFLSSLRTYVRTYNVITGTLFLSLATMLVAFCLGLFLTLHGERAIFLPIAVTATFLVGYIVCTKFPLFVESFTTYKLKNSLFEKNIGDEVDRIFEMLNKE